MNEKYVSVIGGLNLDLAGLSEETYREKNSNIGKIRTNAGGVGHNIAQNLTRLEVPTYLLTVYGDDYFGKILEQDCQKNNIRLDYAKKIKGAHSSTYLYVADDKRDMVSAINDMGIIENITPEFLEARMEYINNSEICVIDGNIPKASIDWLGENCEVPIFVDPVSVSKVDRFENILNKIDTFKPNESEAEILTGISVTDEESGAKSAKKLNKKGIKNVFISLGEKGILCSRNQEVALVNTLPTDIVSANGAGDCTTATIVWARFKYGNSLPLDEVGLYTQVAANITLESDKAVSPNLNVRNLIKKAASHYKENEK